MKKYYIVGVVLLFLFIIDAYLMLNGKLLVFDQAVYNSVRSISCSFFDGFFKFFTKFGNAKYVLILLAILNLRLSRSNAMMCNAVSLASVGSNTIIKNIIKRSRPDVLRLIKQGGYSFPSGHSMIAFTLYLYLLILVFRNIRNKKLRIILSIFLLIIIFSICISRIYVGVHYGSDVLGGAMLGLAELLFILPWEYRFSGGD